MSAPAPDADGRRTGRLRAAAMRWTEPGWRGTVLGVPVTTALGAAVPLVPRLLQWPAGLGREPTDADIHREYARRMLRYKLDRVPTDEEIDRMLSPHAAGRPVRSGWRRVALSSRTR